MLDMSFFDGTLNRNKVKEVVEATEKKLMYRFGYAYKGAIKKEITKEKALMIVDIESYLDVTEDETEIVLNAYSSNDMW